MKDDTHRPMGGTTGVIISLTKENPASPDRGAGRV
jgi:hypothetical protein